MHFWNFLHIKQVKIEIRRVEMAEEQKKDFGDGLSQDLIKREIISFLEWTVYFMVFLISTMIFMRN